MKKFLLSVLLLSLLFVNINVFAQTRALNLVDTLVDEGIKPTFKNYEENDNQVTIYLFRNNGCGHCRNFLLFLNSIIDSYGKKIKLRSYEVSNSDNYTLKEKVTEFLNEDAPGVPFIVIGKNTFYGFSKESEKKIKQAIENEYKSEKRYDVIDEMEKEKLEKNPNDALYIILPPLGIFIIYELFKRK